MAIRTYGLSGSGIDVDQMVKDMMKARRMSYDKLYQQKTQVEYKKKDYNTLYMALKDFRDNEVFNFRMSSQLKPNKVTLSDDSLAAVTATAEAVAMSRTFRVMEIATNAKTMSSGNITTGGNKNTIAEQFKIDPEATPFAITIDDGKTAKSVTVDPSKSIYELVADINNAGTNIRASYDATLDRFYLFNPQTGEENKLQVTDAQVKVDGVDKNFLQDVLKLDTAGQKGTDAVIQLDGVEVKQSTNNFTVSGLTFNLKAKDPAKEMKIDVAPDIDKMVENVKKFVESYNAIVKKVNDELNEKYYKDFLPLTDAQKKDMKEDEIKAWEEKAKSGMLRNDPMLRGIMSNMRLDFSTPVAGLNGKYKNGIDIGLTTSSYIDEEGKFVDVTKLGGQLSVDEKQLRKALAEDPDVVYKIFAADGPDHADRGIARRLSDTLKAGIDNIANTAGRSADLTGDTESTLAKKLQDMNKRIDAETELMKRMENRYYKQFDAMERAIQRMNQQSMWLAQQFSSK